MKFSGRLECNSGATEEISERGQSWTGQFWGQSWACMGTLTSTSASLVCSRPYPSVGSEQCLPDQPIQQMCCTQPCAHSLKGRRDSNCFTFAFTGTWTLWKGSGFLVGLLVVFSMSSILPLHTGQEFSSIQTS